jgi:hypothetical protein
VDLLLFYVRLISKKSSPGTGNQRMFENKEVGINVPRKNKIPAWPSPVSPGMWIGVLLFCWLAHDPSGLLFIGRLI